MLNFFRKHKEIRELKSKELEMLEIEIKDKRNYGKHLICCLYTDRDFKDKRSGLTNVDLLGTNRKLESGFALVEKKRIPFYDYDSSKEYFYDILEMYNKDGVVLDKDNYFINIPKQLYLNDSADLGSHLMFLRSIITLYTRKVENRKDYEINFNAVKLLKMECNLNIVKCELDNNKVTFGLASKLTDGIVYIFNMLGMDITNDVTTYSYITKDDFIDIVRTFKSPKVVSTWLKLMENNGLETINLFCFSTVYCASEKILEDRKTFSKEEVLFSVI